MTEVVVKLRWEGHTLFANGLVAGRILVINDSRADPVIGCHYDQIGGRVSIHATEAEARAAVEQAAIKALKGE